MGKARPVECVDHVIDTRNWCVVDTFIKADYAQERVLVPEMS